MADLDQKKFAELLPFYVNGTLETEGKQFIERFLQENPAAQNDLTFCRLMAKAVETSVSHATTPEDLDKARQRFHAIYPRKTRMERLQQLCQAWGLTPAFAVAALVVVLQAGVLLRNGIPTEEAMYRSPAQQTAPAYQLRVMPNPQAPFAEIVLLLRQHGCSIVAGPSETGELWIRLDDATQLDRIRQILIDSPLIDEAIPAP